MSAKKILYIRNTEVHDAVATLAAKNDRSINKQAVRLLKQALGLDK